MIVPVVVEGQSLRWYGRIPEIADNSIEFVQLEFRFPEDWDNMVIVAQFTQTKTYNCLLVNNRCFLPMELVGGPCEISVFGYLNEEVTRGTTIPLKLNISRSGFVSSAETPIPPTPDLYAQLIEYFSSIAGSGGGGSGSGTINPEDIAAAVEDYLSKNPPEVPDLSDEVDRAETAASKAEAANANASASANNAGSYATYARDSATSAASSAAAADKAATDAEAAAARAEEAAKVTTDLDTTLTQAGKAADAKAVGDAISKLSGGNADQVGVEPAKMDRPKIFFGSPLQQTKDEIVTTFSYRSETLSFDCYAEIKAQGNSTLNWPKKNQTVKLYTDAECTEKFKVDFKGWGKQNKFVIKAYWRDLTHVRDIVSVRLEGDCMRSNPDYEELPELLKTSPNLGGIDGFPVVVYAAGVYQGRYMWNIPKDKWMTNMDDELDEHCILCSEDYNSSCFRAAANINGNDWTDEIHDTVPASIKTRWNEIISFVMNSTDEEFVANLDSHIKVSTLIDRHIMGLYSCDFDGYGKNQLYITYDGQQWYANRYDKDGTWGNYWTGESMLPPSYGREQYEDMISGRPGNLLFIRLEQLFYQRLQGRWEYLKVNELSIPNTINRVRELYDITPPYVIEEDYASTTANGAFTAIPNKTTCTIQQIEKFVVERHAWMNEYMASLTPEVEVPCTGVSLNTNTLTFTAGGSQTLTAAVTPDGCTDSVTWESDNTSVAIVSGGVVTAIANGSATITAKCGEYSASCSVAVSGIAEAVPCMGITLDKTELSFAAEETQTITATVTPADTTDAIMWNSDNTSIATVHNGVVTPIENGSTTITATCGSYSAICEVVVSCFVMDEQIIAVKNPGLWKANGLDSSVSNWTTSDVMPLPTGFTYDTITVDYAGSESTIIDTFDADKNFVKEYAGRPSSCLVQNVEYFAVAKNVSGETTLNVKFTENHSNAMKIPVPTAGLWKETGLSAAASLWRTSDKYTIPPEITTGKIRFADGVSSNRIITTFDAEGNFIKENADVSQIDFDNTVKYFAVAEQISQYPSEQAIATILLYVYVE